MLDWDDLRSFLAIARHRTLSGAARALSVQQSTMGRRLDALEERAGVTLLQKTPGGYVLTAAGEAVLGHVERIEQEAHAIERTVTGRDVRLEGSVRLTTVETMAVEVLTPILTAFLARYPGITLDLVTDTRTLSLSRREADVAVRMMRPEGHELVARKVGEVGFGLYASPGYLERMGMPDLQGGSARPPDDPHPRRAGRRRGHGVGTRHARPGAGRVAHQQPLRPRGGGRGRRGHRRSLALSGRGPRPRAAGHADAHAPPRSMAGGARGHAPHAAHPCADGSPHGGLKEQAHRLLGD